MASDKALKETMQFQEDETSGEMASDAALKKTMQFQEDETSGEMASDTALKKTMQFQEDETSGEMASDTALKNTMQFQEDEASGEMASDAPLKKTMQFVHQKTKTASLGKTETKKSEPEYDILQCFRQHGFRPKGVAPPDEDVEENMIKFSEKEAPLHFLIAMGFTFDKSSMYVKDRELNGRLIAAIKEARVWVNRMHKSRGQLIFSLAFHASYKVKKYFASLVEAIVNRRINSDVTLYEYLDTLERLEDGVLTLNQLQRIYKATDDDMSEEEMRKRDLRKLFLRLHEMAKEEGTQIGLKALSFKTVTLLHLLATRYKPSLYEHIPLLTRYIGQNIIRTDIELEGALMYLSVIKWEFLDMDDFHKFCGIKVG